MCPPPLASEGRGPHLGAQQAPQARVGGANALLSSPAPSGPGGPLPPASPDLPGLPPMPQGPTQLGWGFGGQGTGLGAQQAPCAQVGGANTLHCSPTLPRGSLPPASPDLPLLRGTDPFWPPLLLPTQDPHILPVH